MGYVGLVLMLWNVILGAKPLSRLISKDYVRLNKIHRALRKYGIFFVLSHPLIQMYSYLENFYWIITPLIGNELELHISFGRLALLIYLIIWITSVLLKSRIRYRPWLYIHYLTYPWFFWFFSIFVILDIIGIIFPA
ncbi:hypothetical protein HC766_00735 [Candidatus Gracilibacteria bacterium]|nr:hypothetical protein [Candidatus Gracilibacteria bacterium]